MPINKKTFCVAPWYSVFIDSDKKMAPCCKYGGKINADSLEEYFFTDEMQNLRDDLLNGIQNKNCSSCWMDEQNGGDSLRLISNRTIALGKKIDLNAQIKDPKLSNIISFDLTLGNLCNLKCVMCSPRLSSQLLAEANANSDLKAIYNENMVYNQASFDWPKNEDFVNWCKEYLPQAIHIKFTGGEPFIIPWIDEVIDHIPDQQKSQCILHFTSNLTVINEKLLAKFKNFKEVWISVSVEGIGDTFEYLRKGHEWKKLIKNMKDIQSMRIPNLILKVNHVVQAPSFHSIMPMAHFFDLEEISIHPILLSRPKHFTLQSLTEKCKQDFLEESSNYAGYNKEFIDYVRLVVEQNLDQDTTMTQKMIEHLSVLDRTRGNSHEKIIPSANLVK